MHPMLLSLLAHISAHRRLLINAYACGLIEEPDPAAAARELQRTFAQSPTLAPPQGSGLDPATSSAPFVATLVDVTGLVIYFSAAIVILRGTLL